MLLANNTPPTHYHEDVVAAASGKELIALAKADPATFSSWKFACSIKPHHRKHQAVIRAEFAEIAKAAGKWRPSPSASSGGQPSSSTPQLAAPEPDPSPLELALENASKLIEATDLPLETPFEVDSEANWFALWGLHDALKLMVAHVTQLERRNSEQAQRCEAAVQALSEQTQRLQAAEQQVRKLADAAAAAQRCEAAVQALSEQTHRLQAAEQQVSKLADTAAAAQVSADAAALAAQADAERLRLKVAALEADLRQDQLRSEGRQRSQQRFDMLLRNSGVRSTSSREELTAAAVAALSPGLGELAAESLVASCSLRVQHARAARGAGAGSCVAPRVSVRLRAPDTATHRQLLRAAQQLRAQPAPPGGTTGHPKLALARALTPIQQELMGRLIPHLPKARKEGVKWNIDYIHMKLYITAAGKTSVVDASTLEASRAG